MLTPTLKDHTGRISISPFWPGSNAWSHVHNIFSLSERFASPFTPLQVSGDDRRPRSRGRGDGRQVTIETQKEM
jgi:hypothetical protein